MAQTLIAPTEAAVPDEQEVHIEDDEEADSPPRAHDPAQPTGRQLAEHRVCHVPFRTWCKWCVLGRGRGLMHRRGPGSMLPIIGVDYFFITSKGVQNPTELADDLRATEQQGDDADATPRGTDARVEDARRKGEIVKCIMVRCSLTKALFAHVIPHKGNDDHNTVADLVLKDASG